MTTATQSDWTPDVIGNLSGKTALVTGANSGLGYYTALHLGKAGARVVITTRGDTKGASTIASLLLDVPAGEFDHIEMDLADLESVRTAAQRFSSSCSELHILVNNAGLMAPPREETAQGFEMQFGVNHLGHFAFTAMLRDSIVNTPGARIVNVTSGAAYAGRIRWHDLQWTSSYRRYMAYCQSKLANVLFTLELNRRLKEGGHDGVSVAAHPGLAATNLQKTTLKRNGSALERFAYRTLLPAAAQSAEQGSWPQLRAATEPGLGGGELFAPGRAAKGGGPVQAGLPRRATIADAQRLWAVSEDLTGITFNL